MTKKSLNYVQFGKIAKKRRSAKKIVFSNACEERVLLSITTLKVLKYRAHVYLGDNLRRF